MKGTEFCVLVWTPAPTCAAVEVGKLFFGCECCVPIYVCTCIEKALLSVYLHWEALRVGQPLLNLFKGVRICTHMYFFKLVHVCSTTRVCFELGAEMGKCVFRSVVKATL